MKVILDFDDVIFNADGFKRGMISVFEGAGYKDVMAIYEEYRRKDTQESAAPFSLKSFISLVDHTLSSTKVDVLYEKMIGFCEHLINQEVLAVLEHVGKENCYIVTNGVTEFQMDKIRRSIGEEGFAGIRVVTGSKKDEIAEICKKHSDEHIVFVDDKQKYFSDIDRDVCKNLQTVLFDKSSGVTRLKKAINEAFTREGKENLFDISSPSEISLPYQEGEIKV